MNKGKWDKLSAADKQAFAEAAKEAVKANRARIDEDEAKAVADLRAKGMLIVENVDKGKFQAVLTPVYADFGKRSARRTSTGSRTTSERATRSMPFHTCATRSSVAEYRRQRAC
jgi:TRAP-type C4-dicarboxylate transport system substrate-binding protein